MNSLLRPEINEQIESKKTQQSLSFDGLTNAIISAQAGEDIAITCGKNSQTQLLLHNPETVTCHIQSEAQIQLTIVLEGERSKNIHIETVLEGNNANITTKILNLKKGDTKTNIRTEDKLKGNENVSKTLITNILGDKAQCQTQALISSGKFANNNDAECSVKSLLLNSGARSIATPLLAITNNSNRAEHEAQSMQLSDRDLFYLESRGIQKEEAVQLIINSMIEDIFQNIEQNEESEKLKELLCNWN